DRQPALLDEPRRPAVQDAALQRRAPGVAAGEDAVARRRAHGGAGVGVGEGHALLGELVEVRRGDLAFGVEAADVAVSEIVGEHVDEVGVAGRGGRRQGQGAQDEARSRGHGRSLAWWGRLARPGLSDSIWGYRKCRPPHSGGRTAGAVWSPEDG